ncbi:hypothetical protein [Rhizobium acidisoli]|uniref:hypothetical protein n=1 Tax=Rhizobium acidisoli TaxID=1538158 RepID=UPI0006BA20DF|nr:hypothetical protein [Rhizobium acidisoli]KPH04384.1 hypothetical protein AOG23_33490 [Rhizobium acidisoli]
MGTDVEVGMRLDKRSGRLEVTKDSQKSEFERLRRLDALFIRKNVYVFPMVTTAKGDVSVLGKNGS